MEPLYVCIGINEKRKHIGMLCVDNNYESIQRKSEERMKEHDIDAYRIYNVMSTGWINECQWWLTEYNISRLESQEIISLLLQKLMMYYEKNPS